MPFIQVRRTGRALRDTATFKDLTRKNAQAHPPTHQRLQLGLPRHSPHSWRIGPAGLLGAKPNPRLPPRGLSQGAWRPIAGDWGPPSPSTGCTLSPLPTRAARGAAVHSGWEKGQGPPNPRPCSKAPRIKMLGPTLTFTSTLNSARTSAPCRAGDSGLLASWALTLTLGRPPRIPS